MNIDVTYIGIIGFIWFLEDVNTLPHQLVVVEGHGSLSRA